MDWDHDLAAREFVQQYLHEIQTPEEKMEKGSTLLLRLIQDLEKLEILDSMNAEVQIRIKGNKEVMEKLNQYALPWLNTSDDGVIDLRLLREELKKQGKAG